MTTITPPHEGALLAYVGASTPVGYGAAGALQYVDVTNGVMVQECVGALTGVDGLKKFETDTPGAELLQATQAAILGVPVFGGTPGCIHPAGHFYVPVGTTNSCPIAKINVSDFTLAATIGAASSSFGSVCDSAGAVVRVAATFQSLPLQRGDAEFLVSRGLLGGGIQNEVAVFNVTGTALMLYAVAITEQVAQLGPGRTAENLPVASFYCVGARYSYGVGDPTPFALYEFRVYANTLTDYATTSLSTNGAVSRRQIRTVSPTQIDATWTNFASVSNPGFDNVDNNVLVIVSTLDAVTNTCYLVKFDAVTGDILWKVAIASGVASIPLDLARSNFKGTLEYLEHGASLDVVRRRSLFDGSLTSSTTWNRGLAAMSGQIYDYLTASLTGLLTGAYAESTGPVPTYLGDYLAGSGNTIPAWRYARIFTGATYDDGDSGGGAVNDTARSQAWAYNLDGHQFYVLSLGTQEGTFVYDSVTDKWAKFDTAGYDQWNMRNGCMWGDRIVAGSSTGVQVWELDPEAVTDEGALSLSHAVTGLIQQRSLDKQSCDSVRVTASVGQIDTAGLTLTAVFNLRFSDDNGQTWSAYYPITLTQADYSAELAWRSLGSFAAPGRVFEFSDSGGLIRIDGADMNPEKDTEQ